MMPESVIAALIQTPFVLAMVYVMQRFLTSMDARDREWQEFAHVMRDSMAELAAAVHDLSQLIVRHDAESMRKK